MPAAIAPSCRCSQEGPKESALYHCLRPLAGLVRAVCWSIRDRSEGRAACCEVHLVSLVLPDDSSGHCQATGVEVLQVGHFAQHGRCALPGRLWPDYIGPCTANTLVSGGMCAPLFDCMCVSGPSPQDAALQTSALPPFATLVEPAHDAVVLALEPEQAVADVSSHSALGEAACMCMCACTASLPKGQPRCPNTALACTAVHTCTAWPLWCHPRCQQLRGTS